MSNSLLTPLQITRKALMILHQKARFIRSINRQYDDSFANSGAKIGDSLRIRLPNQYTVRTGPNLSTQATAEQQVTLQVANQRGVDVSFSSTELTMQLDDFAERILEPAMSVLAASIEADALSMYADVSNFVGTPGTVPNALLTYLQARQRLQESLTPEDDNRALMLSPLANVTIVDALKGLFHDSTAVRQQYKEGSMGRTSGFDWYESTLMPTHVNGTMGGTPLVNGASQTGTSLITDGWTGSNTITRGTVFTIAGVFAVHPETKAVTPNLQQFTVTATATASTGNATLSISPALVATGALQTVSALPADNAAITVQSGAASAAHQQNLAFHRDAFTFATADLVMPKGVDFAAREMMDGISMRIVRQYNISNDTFPCRIDVLYGYRALRPQMACRITQ